MQLQEGLGQPNRKLWCKLPIRESFPATDREPLTTAVLSPWLASPAKWAASACKLRQIFWTNAGRTPQPQRLFKLCCLVCVWIWTSYFNLQIFGAVVLVKQHYWYHWILMRREGVAHPRKEGWLHDGVPQTLTWGTYVLSGDAVMVKVSTLHWFDFDMGNMVDTHIPGQSYFRW